MNATLENLKVLTADFFFLHWNETKIGKSSPEWSDRWTFIGSGPNYNKQGVYAFVSNEGMVTYVGVASSRGGGPYRGHGLGARIGNAYVRVVSEGVYRPNDSRLEDAGGLVTIGFEPEQAYLSNALELFLIGRFDTEHNSNRPGS